MASPNTETNTKPEPTIQQRLDALVLQAPERAVGRKPTPEEVSEHQKFYVKVKEFLQDVPPESGLNYKSVMEKVRESQRPPPPTTTITTTTTTMAAAAAEITAENSQNTKNQWHRKNENKKNSKDTYKKKVVPRKMAGDNVSPRLDYLCVLDFEATCNERRPAPKPQEIIEFPVLLVNSRTGEVEDTFHFYIKPDVHPALSPFCTELTGITQDMVDGGIGLDEALLFLYQWLDGHNIVSEGADPLFKQPHKKRFAFVTCGDWDLKTCLPQQLRYHGKKTPAMFSAWINIKFPYGDLYNDRARGMTSMLNGLGLKLEGRHHSGIDDCKNIARICARMLEDGWIPRRKDCW